MLIERQKKKLTAIRRMRKIANRPAKHRALQHSAHASLRAFFPLDLFVDRSVYLPRRPAVSLGFETGQRCPNSRRNDWNQIYLKEREKREMQTTIPTLKRTRVYKTKSKTKSKTSKWIKISNWYGRNTWTVVKFLSCWRFEIEVVRIIKFKKKGANKTREKHQNHNKSQLLAIHETNTAAQHRLARLGKAHCMPR